MIRFLFAKAVVQDRNAQVLHSLRLWVLAPTVASVDAEHGEQELPFHSAFGHNAILDPESHRFSNETMELVFANGVAHDVRKGDRDCDLDATATLNANSGSMFAALLCLLQLYLSLSLSDLFDYVGCCIVFVALTCMLGSNRIALRCMLLLISLSFSPFCRNTLDLMSVETCAPTDVCFVDHTPRHGHYTERSAVSQHADVTLRLPRLRRLENNSNETSRTASGTHLENNGRQDRMSNRARLARS